jgi:hypothetical protein
MDAPRAQLSTSEVAFEASNWMVGLGILTMTLSPFALPALVLALVLVLPALPLLLVALVTWLLARIILLPLRLLRNRSSRRGAAASQVDEAPALTEVSGTRPRAQAPTARTNAASVR